MKTTKVTNVKSDNIDIITFNICMYYSIRSNMRILCVD